MLNGTEVIAKDENVSGDSSLTAVLCTGEVKLWDNIIVRVSSNGNLNTFELDLEVKQVRYRKPFKSANCDSTDVTPDTLSSLYSTLISAQVLLSTVEITKNIPKIKILDFLKGLYSMFNLTSFVNSAGVIVVKPLPNYYKEGNTIDITKFVNNENIAVKRMNLYKNIEFKYKDAKTFGTINKNEISQVEFGNLEYESSANGTSSSLIFDGTTYKVQLPFEKLYYERLSDEDNKTDFTTISNGWLADSNQSPVITSPMLFYNINQTVTSSYKMGFLGKSNPSTYNRASNNSLNQSSGLGFNTEFDEFTGNEISKGLFYNGYREYITTIFDKQTRIFDLKMKANLAFLLEYELNDTLLLNGEEFLINNIRTDLTTGITDIELILKFKVVLPLISASSPPTTPTGLTLAFAANKYLRFNWNGSTDDVAVEGYKIYIDSVLFDTIAVFTEYTAIGLSNNTSYSIQVSSFDNEGNESSLTSVVAMSTTDARDILPPTAPTDLAFTRLTDTTILITWGASTDNIAVAGYNVFLNDVDTYTTTSLSQEITLLATRTSYNIKVQAEDGVGNLSTFSNTINVTTL